MSDMNKNTTDAQSDALLQLSAQANATKQLADELISANIGLRSQGMLLQHHLNAAKELNSNLESENASLKTELNALKEKISNFEKNSGEEDQEAAA